MSAVLQPQIDCSSAEEFLNALSPIGKNFIDHENNSPWLFRGQGKDYPILPSLFRKDNRAVDKFNQLTKRNIKDPDQLRLVERDLLIQFFEIADKRGLILPDDSQELRYSLGRIRSDFFVTNYFKDGLGSEQIWSLIALAQHYGIPTRLLDWTRKAYIAAFFAAEDALKATSEMLVVWAFYIPTLGITTSYVRNAYSLRVITAPSATNPNLKAQQGVFTVVHPDLTEETSGTYLTFPEIVKNVTTGAYSKDIGDCLLQKFTLPGKEAPALLHLLAKLDITPSAIYPGYQSIIDDIKNQAYWL